MENEQENEMISPEGEEALDDLELNEDEEGSGKTEEKEETEETKSKIGRFRRLGDKLKGKKWVTGAVLVMVFTVLGWGITQGYKWLPSTSIKRTVQLKKEDTSPDYFEEKLASLYIPLPEDEEREFAVIRFSVIWDGLASFRYKSMELQIRDRLYRYVVGFSQEKTDLEEKSSFLEAEMSKIFRESLGMENLAVKIKEIKEI